MLKAKEDRWKTVMANLRDNHFETQITGPRPVGVEHRAAFTVEEAGGPREFGAVEDHSGRGRRHALTPSPLVASAMIERMGDTVNGR